MENNNFDTNNADNDIYTFSVDETWGLTEETVTPAIQLIQNINEFLCSVLNKDRIIEDGIYGNTIRTTAENVKEYISMAELEGYKNFAKDIYNREMF